MIRRMLVILTIVVLVFGVFAISSPKLASQGTSTALSPEAILAYVLLGSGLLLAIYLAYVQGGLGKVWDKLLHAILELAQGHLDDVTEEEVHALADHIYDKYLPALLQTWLSRENFRSWAWSMWLKFLVVWKDWPGITEKCDSVCVADVIVWFDACYTP